MNPTALDNDFEQGVSGTTLDWVWERMSSRTDKSPSSEIALHNGNLRVYAEMSALGTTGIHMEPTNLQQPVFYIDADKNSTPLVYPTKVAFLSKEDGLGFVYLRVGSMNGTASAYDHYKIIVTRDPQNMGGVVDASISERSGTRVRLGFDVEVINREAYDRQLRDN